MGIDLDFWKYKRGARKENEKVYEEVCCDGGIMDCLEELPVKDILKRVGAEFADWTAVGEKDYEKDGCGAFSISVTPQSVRFDCYDMSGEDMNRLMDVMQEFDCPLYDPQLGERFDSSNMGLFGLMA